MADRKTKAAALGLPEDYDLESGLPDDFDYQIDRAEFGYDPEYKDAKGENPLLLIWHGHSLTPGVETSRPILWSTGNGWATRDGGRTATHERGKRSFVETSAVGQLFARCYEMPGAEEWARVVRARKVGPREARLWDGMKFHLRREKISFGAGLQERERLMPTAFLGVVGELPAQAASPAPDGAAQAVAPSPGGDLRAKLVKLAKACSSVKEFQSKATNLPELFNDEQLLGEVMDEGPNGFYGRFHG